MFDWSVKVVVVILGRLLIRQKGSAMRVLRYIKKEYSLIRFLIALSALYSCNLLNFKCNLVQICKKPIKSNLNIKRYLTDIEFKVH